MANFDREDLNNLYNKLDRINRNIENANQPSSSSGSSGGGIFEGILILLLVAVVLIITAIQLGIGTVFALIMEKFPLFDELVGLVVIILGIAFYITIIVLIIKHKRNK